MITKAPNAKRVMKHNAEEIVVTLSVNSIYLIYTLINLTWYKLTKLAVKKGTYYELNRERDHSHINLYFRLLYQGCDLSLIELV